MQLSSLPATKAEARNLGSVHYFTGKPCLRGHIVHRYTSTGLCEKCAKMHAAVAMGKVRKNDPEKFKRWHRAAAKNFVDKLKRDGEFKGLKKRYRDSYKNRCIETDPKKFWCCKQLWAYKRRAAVHGVPFDLDGEYLISICVDECPVFGTKLVYMKNGGDREKMPSVDRIVPEKGYVRGNVVVMSMKANTIKNSYGSADVLRVGEWMKGMGI